MTTATTLSRGLAARLARLVAAAALAALNAVWQWHRRERDLRHVMQLDDHLMRDIGLSRDDVIRVSLRVRRRR